MTSIRLYEIRKNALEIWSAVTGRVIFDELGELSNDNFSGAYECKWQNSFEGSHVNLFCSLGDWACNLTDLLKETKYDKLFFKDPEEAKVVFRYYTRILLIVSEMLTDFQDIYLQAENLHLKKKQVARTYYSRFSKVDEYTRMFDFINCICKHKTQHLHQCNNHSKIIFEDVGSVPLNLKYIRLGDTNTSTEKDAILVPELSKIIGLVTVSYSILDIYFNSNKEKFKSLCEKYKSD